LLRPLSTFHLPTTFESHNQFSYQALPHNTFSIAPLFTPINSLLYRVISIMADSEYMSSSTEIPMEAQVDLIWQMGLASLASNNNELVLPQSMATYLPQASVESLKLQLRYVHSP
jgi:hypothetical protein